VQFLTETAPESDITPPISSTRDITPPVFSEPPGLER
jgi:hypothetical protein